MYFWIHPEFRRVGPFRHKVATEEDMYSGNKLFWPVQFLRKMLGASIIFHRLPPSPALPLPSYIHII